MTVVELANAEAMWAATQPFLAADAANNTHSLSALQRLLRDGARGDEKFLLVTDDDDAALGALVRVDTKHAFLSRMSGEVARLLGGAVREQGMELAGVVGANEAVNGFVLGYAKPTRPHATLMLYVHEGDVIVGNARGFARVATAADIPDVVRMLDAFDDELSMIKATTPTAERAARRIAAQEVLVWQVGDEVAAMAGTNPLPAHSARVGPVYVLPTHRRRGVAQAVAAAATRHVQRNGPRTVFLFTDATNAASNKAYQRIGYRHVADHLHRLC